MPRNLAAFRVKRIWLSSIVRVVAAGFFVCVGAALASRLTGCDPHPHCMTAGTAAAGHAYSITIPLSFPSVMARSGLLPAPCDTDLA